MVPQHSAGTQDQAWTRAVERAGRITTHSAHRSLQRRHTGHGTRRVARIADTAHMLAGAGLPGDQADALAAWLYGDEA